MKEEQKKMPRTKVINEELRELIEDHKGSKYWNNRSNIFTKPRF